MYRTSVITDEISQDVRVAAKLAAQYHLDALEIRSVNEHNPFQFEKRDVADALAASQEYGLPICALGSPLFKCALDDHQAREQDIESFKRAMETLHVFGAKLIRGFTFLNLNDGGARMNEVIDLYGRVIEIAKDAGAQIVIESEPSVYTPNIAALVDFLKKLGDPTVAAVYDPGNEIVDPTAPPPFPDGYDLLLPYMRHVHVKDIKRTPGAFVPAMLGEGSVDFDGIFERLKKDYSGYVSVETHYRVAQGVSDEDLLHPQGSSFSAGGYEATTLYFEKLRDRYHWMEANT